ncbi:MAG: circadian clock protein KaiC [Bacteroidota bacterium]
MSKKQNKSRLNFPKAPTGIEGLDVITHGGLPRNRPTLLLGNTGCGKTIMGIEFLVHGITLFDEPGAFISFEEKTNELEVNIGSFAFGTEKFIADGKLYLEHIAISPGQTTETGKYNIEGLFVRIAAAIKSVNAKRIVLDSMDSLFNGFDYKILRSEFKRLLSWLKEKNVTAIITGEAGNAFLTSNGAEEYVADCVILLTNRVVNQITTRRLRVVKYRGSIHGNNEYPFTIDAKGITVLPQISLAVNQLSSSKRVLSGIGALDSMLDKKGFYMGSSILISGTAGTGKTSIAATFASSICDNKQRCLFCAFEEAPNQVLRNMRSIGIDLRQYEASGHLHFYYARPTLQNLELHFMAIRKTIEEKKPKFIILDPITNLMTEGPNSDIRSMLTRFVDYLKTQQITVMFTAAITVGSIERNPSDEGISSMVDTWIMVQDIEVDAKRTRSLCIMKSRGMPHSNEVQRFVISKKGIQILPLITATNNSQANIKRSAKEHWNLSTSKESIGIK